MSYNALILLAIFPDKPVILLLLFMIWFFYLVISTNLCPIYLHYFPLSTIFLSISFHSSQVLWVPTLCYDSKIIPIFVRGDKLIFSPFKGSTNTCEMPPIDKMNSGNCSYLLFEPSYSDIVIPRYGSIIYSTVTYWWHVLWKNATPCSKGKLTVWASSHIMPNQDLSLCK